jgi:spore germination cell wall hydrolase CwlJ-like protein
MNRLHSGKYPPSVCGVVGQKNQFAPGVLSKPMKEGQSRARAERMANAVLSGKRHRSVGNAMFFHTAGYNFPYNNMHYKVIAGGNAFYEKRTAKPGQRNTKQIEVAGASPRARPRPESPRIELARGPRRAAPAQRWAAAPRSQEPARVVAFVPEETAASIEDLILLEAN